MSAAATHTAESSSKPCAAQNCSMTGVSICWRLIRVLSRPNSAWGTRTSLVCDGLQLRRDDRPGLAVGLRNGGASGAGGASYRSARPLRQTSVSMYCATQRQGFDRHVDMRKPPILGRLGGSHGPSCQGLDRLPRTLEGGAVDVIQRTRLRGRTCNTPPRGQRHEPLACRRGARVAPTHRAVEGAGMT
jgi:hypothetical protein